MTKIAIIGLAPSAKDVPDDWEWWGLPWDARRAVHCDRLFEMHDERLIFNPEYGRRDDYRDYLSEMIVPIYMQRHHDDIPMSVEYPFEDVEDVFGGVAAHQRYGSMISYMLAMAIIEEPAAIGLWGVDLIDDFDHERPNIAYLLGVASGRYIDVALPSGNTILERRSENNFNGHFVSYPGRYGYLEH